MQESRVLDVGNCDPDHGAMRRMLTANFDVEIDRVMFVAEAREALRRSSYALVLVNRRIFADDSDGMELVHAMRVDPENKTPVMLVSNFPEAQDRAVAAGATPGFGKAALEAPRTIELLGKWLPRK